ncbi:MAG TPA: LamG domain-containing protein [Candidatus Thermoplasmatota archaeon]|nr:LamG domain-containing protein [Candidatus Thermoplasmatota archaeon]
MRSKCIGLFIGVMMITTAFPLMMTAPSVQADPSTGLIGYWSFNEGSGSIAHDSSGYGNDGALIGAATWMTGVNGSALEITDTEYVGGIPSSCDDSITTEFTVTAWVKWYGLPSYNHGSYFFDGRGNPYAGIGFLLYISFQSTVGFWLNDVNMDSNMMSKSTMPINAWTFVAAAFNSTSNLGAIYINGVLDNTESITKEFFQSSDSPVIGTNHWAPGDGQWAPINGVEDEVRLYNRALTAQEIYTLYKQDLDAIDISIDIIPGEYPNMINPFSPGKLPVAILTTAVFNASDVNPDSISFLGAAPLVWKMEDLDADGDMDMLLQFSIPDLEFDLLVDESIYRYAVLHGETTDGTWIMGRDTIVLFGQLIRQLWQAFLQKLTAFFTMLMTGFKT